MLRHTICKESSVIISLIAMVGAYLIGSIPTGYLLAYAYGVKDITQHGSGNIGATNVARVMGKQFFLIVLLLDALKAYIVVIFAQNYVIEPLPLALVSMSVMLGNCFSIFLKGKGGKGIATGIGI